MAGLARYRNFNFIKVLAVKEIGAREKFLELQVPGVITISTEPMSFKHLANQKKGAYEY